MRLFTYGLRIAAFATLFAAVPTATHAQSVRGPATVVDGDSLAIGVMQVRLFGIDAPEFDQKCFDNGVPIACGEMAKAQLQGMIGHGEVSCLSKTTDAYGRMVAVCRVAGVDVGKAMVENGWATAFRKYSEDYVASEQRAQANRLGIWAWDFQSPEDYRLAVQAKEKPVQEARSQPRGRQSPRRWERNGQCLIKGNHSRRGDWIYHLPGMPYYDATRAEEYFCTEEDALAAGYRRAIVR